jgi:catechol 2,3-dioxygenase-like lactoylglutathione lyase family enzyme
MTPSAPRLHHLALRTGDVPGLVRFYRSWFGLAVLQDRAPASVWLALGAGAVLMIEARRSGEPEIPAGSLELIAFQVTAEEQLALRARLTDAGMLEGETAHTVYFRDPDGRRLGASSYPLP